jgi:hypothetical protein
MYILLSWNMSNLFFFNLFFFNLFFFNLEQYVSMIILMDARNLHKLKKNMSITYMWRLTLTLN